MWFIAGDKSKCDNGKIRYDVAMEIYKNLTRSALGIFNKNERMLSFRSTSNPLSLNRVCTVLPPSRLTPSNGIFQRRNLKCQDKMSCTRSYFQMSDSVLNANAEEIIALHDLTRSQTDLLTNRLEPGTEEFSNALKDITSRISFLEGGTGFYDKSALNHIHSVCVPRKNII